MDMWCDITSHPHQIKSIFDYCTYILYILCITDIFGAWQLPGDERRDGILLERIAFCMACWCLDRHGTYLPCIWGHIWMSLSMGMGKKRVATLRTIDFDKQKYIKNKNIPIHNRQSIFAFMLD
jgi:hypothetical protein